MKSKSDRMQSIVIEVGFSQYLDTEGSQLRKLVEDSAEVVRLPLGVRVVCDVVS